jgi:hypothetical protein
MKKTLLYQVFVLAGLLAILASGSAVAGPVQPRPDVPLRPEAAPLLAMPSEKLADPNNTVKIPVSFTGNSNNVSSVVFSIDYDNVWLVYDNSLPNALQVAIPNGFVGGCSPNTMDSFAEINCFIYDGSPPLEALPDGVFVTVTLRTANAPNGTLAAVNFSSTSPVSFGNTSGQAVVGSGQNGSVRIGAYVPPVTASINYLPLVLRPEETPVGGNCTYTTIANSTFEPQGGYWYFPPTIKTAWFTNYRSHSAAYSGYTGIDPNLQPGVNLFSYSSIRTNHDLPFVIPGNATKARLTFWHYSLTTEYLSKSAEDATLVGEQKQPLPPTPEIGKLLELPQYAPDVQYVLVLYPSDAILAYPVWELINTNGWVNREINLLNWRGQPIKLQFGVANDGYGGVSAMYIDDVVLEVCTP